jgi:hypothetical protein
MSMKRLLLAAGFFCAAVASAHAQYFMPGQHYPAQPLAFGLGSFGQAEPPNGFALGINQGGNLQSLTGASTSPATAPTNGTAQLCIFNSSAPTLTNGQSVGRQCDSSGNALVNIASALPVGANTIGGVTQSGGAWSFNLTQVNGNTISTATTGMIKVGIADGSGNTINSTSNALNVAVTTGVNVSQIGGTNILTGGANGSVGVGGLAANNAAISGNPVFMGGVARSSEISAATNGNIVEEVRDLVGRAIVFPYANKENLIEGAASVTGTTSTSLIAAPGASTFIYVTAVSCFNSGSTGTTVSFQNGSAGTTIWEGYAAPSGGGFTHTFVTPIGGVNNMTANTALFFQAGSATTTLYCNASGFKGT